MVAARSARNLSELNRDGFSVVGLALVRREAHITPVILETFAQRRHE